MKIRSAESSVDSLQFTVYSIRFKLNKLIVITGPTAVGKTALTLEIAKHYGIPIINADSRQIYKELRIGTASPTVEQMQQVYHYFVGTKSISDYYNASMYEQEVMQLLQSLFTTSPIQILSGGRMMYIDAVCNGIDDIPTVRDDIRNEMKRRYEEEGLESLCEDLRRLDPEHYEVVDRQNHRRVIHALEICYQTGKTYTSFRTQAKKKAMLPYREANALNTVGYKELFDYFDGRWPLAEAVERIKGNTRRYARKQLTWYKRDEQVTWFHPHQQQEILNLISHYE